MAFLGNYRVFEKNIIPSQSGNGIIALYNKSDSSKIIKVNAVEIYNYRKDGVSSASITCNDLEMIYINQVPTNPTKTIIPVSLDTDNTSSGLNCYLGGNVTYATRNVCNFLIKHGFFGANSNVQFGRINLGDKKLCYGSIYNTLDNKSGSTEGFVLEQNTGVSFRSKDTLSTDSSTMIKEFNTFQFEILVKKTSNSETFIFSDYFTIEPEGEPCFSIFNSSVTNYTILDVKISEVGDTSTPYFMFVPIDGIDTDSINDVKRNISVIKYDTNDGDYSTNFILKKDVVVIPKGFNQGLFLYNTSESSQLPSKGLNYLITKDFLGPIYSAFFPEKSEYYWNRNATTSTHLNSKSHTNSLIFKGSDLIIRPGEGVAIVSSAEAMILTSGVPQIINKYSTGKYEFSLSFSMEDITVDLTLSGLQTNTEIRILEAGSTTELAGVENSTTTFTWSYVPQANYYVDIVVHSIGYEYLRLNNVVLGTNGTSIPIQQRIDRNNYNP